MKTIIVSAAAIALGIVLLVACDATPVEQRAKSAEKACIDNGGIPIFSVWDLRVLVDCKFPPAHVPGR